MHARVEEWHVALGDAVIVTGRDGRDATPRARKARALVAALAATPGRAVSRAELIALLWSDRGREQARASLRQCLFDLRGETPGLIATDGEQVALAAAVATLPSRAVPLADLDALDPAFDRWLATQRAAWPVDASQPPSAVSQPRYRPALLAGLAVAAMVAGGAWLGLRPAAPHPPVVLLTPLAGPGGRAAPAATKFADAVHTTLAASRVRLLPDSSSGDADWIVAGAADGDAATARVTTSAHALLWSARVAGTDDDAALRLGHRLARTLACAAGGPPVRRDAAATARLMQFCDVMQSGGFQSDDEGTLALARRVVGAAPQDAYAHGHLAATLAINAKFAPPALAPPMQAEAAREATRALALDPRTGEAWLARGLLRDDLSGQEAAFRHGLAAEPDNPNLPNHLAGVLTSAGRLDEALVEARQALAFDPASPAKRATVADLLLRTGSPRAAFALLDDPGIYDPERIIVRVRVILLQRNGDMAATRAALAAAGDAFEPAVAARLIARTRAIDDPHGPGAAALLASLPTTGDPGLAGYRVAILVSVGRTGAALDEALRAPVNTEVFFRPDIRPLLLSPRFPAVARFQGLWAYWTATDHWPDICSDPALGWRCPVKSPSTAR